MLGLTFRSARIVFIAAAPAFFAIHLASFLSLAYADTVSRREIREEEGREHDEEDLELTRIKIEGRNGSFIPSVLNVSVFAPVVFELSATDRDYDFEIQNTGIKYRVKKGSVTEISLATLGKGEYLFTCGAKCSGTIHVAPEVDDDDEEEDEARESAESLGK